MTPGFAPAAEAKVTQGFVEAAQTQPLTAAASALPDRPIVFARDRRDGSFWGTSFGLNALKAPEVHENSLMDVDDADVDESQYYEEPREAIAARTGTKLPTYADDAVDNLHSHRSTYSMHDAKHMKNKVSYDLFSTSSKTPSSTERAQEDSTTIVPTKSSHKHGSSSKALDDKDDGLDFESLLASQDFGGSSKSKKSKKTLDADAWSDEKPKKSKKSKKSSDGASGDDDDAADDDFSAESIERSLSEDKTHKGKKLSPDDSVPAWISFGRRR